MVQNILKVATIIRKGVPHNEIGSHIERTALALGASLSLICFSSLALPKHCTSTEKGREPEFATSINMNSFFFLGLIISFMKIQNRLDL